ncbi:MAG: HEAT repeat domain-containing protein [Thermodesulfobacteriota bacterium]|nr:HEAT repeat domain-containing protein [Thermodesulfobacteriota bacterium]
MVDKTLSGREIKKQALKLLARHDHKEALGQLSDYPPDQLVNALFSFLYHTNDYIRWHAIAAMGLIVPKIADREMERARVIMRRLMWNLNDESGGIGWGSPEAMGEILACHEGLANEYVQVFLSYSREDGNYLEHPALQRGLLWGIGRLSRVRPYLIGEHAVSYLIPFLESEDGPVRGLAAWIMGIVKRENARPYLERLIGDNAEATFYDGQEVLTRRVTELAEEALAEIDA